MRKRAWLVIIPIIVFLVLLMTGFRINGFIVKNEMSQSLITGNNVFSDIGEFFSKLVGGEQESMVMLDPGGEIMTTASRTECVAPCGVFFDAVDESGWDSGVVQPKGFTYDNGIAGVKIVRVSSDNSVGTGTLYYRSDKYVAYKSPGKGVGSYVFAGNGGNVEVASAGGEKIFLWVDNAKLGSTTMQSSIGILNGGENADYGSFYYEWDFGDPSSGMWTRGAKLNDGSYPSKNKDIGYVAAHVYENPGAYNVKLKVIYDTGNVAEYEQTIIVADAPASGWTTYYVANNGNDNNPGTEDAPFKTFDKAMSVLQDKTKILFKRGETFAASTLVDLDGKDTLYFGAYGNGELPRIGTSNLPQNNALFTHGNDVRFVDLWLDGDYPNRISGGSFSGPTNSLILRVRIQDMQQPWFSGGNTVVQEVNSTNMYEYHFWIAGNSKTAIMGSIADKGNAQALSRTYASKLVIAHNEYYRPSATKYTIRFMRGDPSGGETEQTIKSGKWIYVSGNYLEDVGIALQGDNDDQYVPNNVVIEGNVVRIINLDEAEIVNIYGGEKCTIRNNKVISDKSVIFATLSPGYNGKPYHQNDLIVLHNTISSTTPNYARLFSTKYSGEADGYNYVLENNILHVPNAALDYSIIELKNSNSPIVKSDYNIYYAPQHPGHMFYDGTEAYTLDGWKAEGYDLHSILGNPLLENPVGGNFRLEEDSLAIGLGDANTLLYSRTDSDGNYRDSEPDAGASEYTNVRGQDCQTGYADNVSQYNITWYFDKCYSVGQFVNGDFWVVGPVNITSISPKSENVSRTWCDSTGNQNYPHCWTGYRVINGAMINPSPRYGLNNGYDSEMHCWHPTLGRYYCSTASSPRYNSSLNVALGVSEINPLRISQNSSLVSVVSRTDMHNVILKTAAVLTVLTSTPVEGSFRPAYSGSQKKLYNQNQINSNLLLSLNLVAATPRLEQREGDSQGDSAERMFERPWIDHMPANSGEGQDSHPYENMAGYGADVGIQTTRAMLMLNLNYSYQQKQKLLTRYLQLGIDLYGIAQDGGQSNWIGSGGHGTGRKLPIAFAGLLLNDQNMKDFVRGSDAFSEESSEYYSNTAGRPLYGQCEQPYDYWNNIVNDDGSRTCNDPHHYIDGGVRPGRSYQNTVSQPGKGIALAVRLVPGLEQIWNDVYFLDYTDRWVGFGAWTQPDVCAPIEGICVGGTNAGGYCNSARENGSICVTGINSASGYCNYYCPGNGWCNYSARWSNYGVTFGMNSSGGCIVDTNPTDGIGRFAGLHGFNRDGLFTGIYRDIFVDNLWAAYRNLSEEACQQGYARNISQYNITWFFDKCYRVGQFVNGDFWVLGPVNITNVDPAPQIINGTWRHGSMINPSMNTTRAWDGYAFNGRQGFDQRGYGWNQSLMKNYPLIVDASTGIKSVCSAVSYPQQTDGTFIYTIGVLTVVSQVPPEGSFRPPYAGDNKKYYFISDLREDLPSLTPASNGRPSMQTMEARVQRPQIDYISPGANGGYSNNVLPRASGVGYGREISVDMGNVALILACDPNTVGNKKNLSIYMAQTGIDKYHALLTGTDWRGSGGHDSGRKIPILLAGWLLNDSSMLNIGTTYQVMPQGMRYFQEDDQTSYLTQEMIDAELRCMLNGSFLAANETSVTFDSDTYRHIIKGSRLHISSGKGEGQIREVLQGADTLWLSYVKGNATTATANTMTLSNAVAQPNGYTGRYIRIIQGRGIGQVRQITSYDTNTKIATISQAWATVPDASSIYEIPTTAILKEPWNIVPDETSKYKNLGYSQTHLGMPEWSGGAFELNWNSDINPAWSHWYRSLNGYSWPGQTLAALIYGLEDEWNHDAYFDYVDRYMIVTKTNGTGDAWGYNYPGGRAYSVWAETMWDIYRGMYNDTEQSYCGDGICNNGETCSSCSADCTCGDDGGNENNGGGGGSSGGTTPPNVPPVNITDQIADEECISEWSCGNWTNCDNGTQLRVCIDKNGCESSRKENQNCNETVVSDVFQSTSSLLNKIRNVLGSRNGKIIGISVLIVVFVLIILLGLAIRHNKRVENQRAFIRANYESSSNL